MSTRRFSPGLWILSTGLWAYLAAFLVYPLGCVALGAFRGPGGLSLRLIARVLADPRQWEILMNSVNLALGVTLAATALALPAAVAMRAVELPGRSLLRGLLLAPLVLPPFVGAVGLRRLCARFGTVNLLLMDTGITDRPLDLLGNGWLGLVLMEALHLYPILYLQLSASLSKVGADLEEAARAAGAGPFAVWRRVLMPLAAPGYFAGASLVFIGSLTDLGTPLIFDRRDLLPVQVFAMLNDVHENPAGYVLVLLMILAALAFFAFARWMESGVAADEGVRGAQASVRARRARPALAAALWMIAASPALLAILPLLAVALTAFADRWVLAALPQTITTRHLLEVFSHPLTVSSLRNSLLLACASTTLDLGAGLGVAYIATRTRLPGRHALEVLALLPLAVPGVLVAFGYLVGFSGTFLDARLHPFPLLVLAYGTRRLPILSRVAAAGLSRSGGELEQAARSAGAGPARAFLRVSLPLLLPHLLAGAILCFSLSVLEVSDSLMLAQEEPSYPIAKALYALLARPDGTAAACALALLATLLVAAGLLAALKIAGRSASGLFRAS